MIIGNASIKLVVENLITSTLRVEVLTLIDPVHQLVSLVAHS